MTSLNISIIYPTNYRHKDLTLEEIYQAVSSYVKIPDYKVKCRKREIAYARHIFCFIARMYTPFSLKAIAGHLGGRDHAEMAIALQTIRGWD